MFRLLIVDDQPAARAMLARWVDARPQIDMEILQAGTLAEALAISSESQPDITFFDLHLPDADEDAVIAAIHAMKPPVIVVSGYPGDFVREGKAVDIETECRIAGAADYLEKTKAGYMEAQAAWLDVVIREYTARTAQFSNGR